MNFYLLTHGQFSPCIKISFQTYLLLLPLGDEDDHLKSQKLAQAPFNTMRGIYLKETKVKPHLYLFPHYKIFGEDYSPSCQPPLFALF